jgi:hypothetical protein
MKFIASNQILLCNKKSCCPVLEKVSDDEYTLSDDYQGKVRLSRDELSMMAEAFKKLDESV